MSDPGRADATSVLRERVESLTSQILELEDLRARVLEAERKLERDNPKAGHPGARL